MQPTFIDGGATPSRYDSRWFILAKWLGAVQNALGGAAIAANDPKRNDTRYVLLKKINCARVGLPYTS